MNPMINTPRVCWLFLFTLVLLLHFPRTVSAQKINAYLIPGMGTDYREFHRLDFSETNYIPHFIQLVDYDTCKGLDGYAHLLATQIDTTQPFVIIGVSMGGMLAVEMTQFLHPEGVILISSAKGKQEIPFRYKLGRVFPVYRLITDKMLAKMANRPKTFESIDRPEDREVYKNMLLATGADFFVWQMNAIVHWKFDMEELKTPVYHIHGAKDNVLPLRKVAADVVVENGDHKMVINYPDLMIEYINAFH